MTRDEFRTLEAGDRVRNPMTESAGTVQSTYETRAGHHVEIQWDGAAIVLGSFGENSTAWMHWTREEKGGATGAP